MPVTGCGLSAIDAKGRVALPPLLRNAVLTNGEGRTVYFGKHPQARALQGFDSSFLEEQSARIAAAEAAAASTGLLDLNYGARRNFFASAEPVPFDASGRFTLTPRMKDRAGLEGLAFFAGLGSVIEVWNPHLLLEDPNGDPDLQDDARWALKEKGLL